jgi:mannose-6-phosphate isomerase-like protein (cupin superfamily)
MKAKIKQQDLSSEFWTSEQCYITELSNSPDDPEVSIARTRVEPGVTTRWHRLRGIGERYCILYGKGRMEVEGLEPKEVYPGDVVLIPAGYLQRITNVGPDDLVFLAISTPRFTVDVYEEA